MIREIENLLGNKFLKKFEIKVICECNQNYDNEIKITTMCIHLVCYSEEFKDEFLLFVFIFFLPNYYILPLQHPGPAPPFCIEILSIKAED